MTSIRFKNPAICVLVIATILNAQSADDFFHDVSSTTTAVGRFGAFEASFRVRTDISNPFDPRSIKIFAAVREPGGRRVEIPAFFIQDFRREGEAEKEALIPIGSTEWRIRFTPRTVGSHELTLCAEIPGAAKPSLRRGPTLRFQSVASARSGFVRVAENARAFATDDGAPFFSIGANTCWGPDTFAYDRWFLQMVENGMNTGRLWIGPIGLFTLEGKNGLGRINQQAAWRLDYVLQLAERHNIRLMFCLDSFNSLRIKPDYAEWQNSPYNAANGGPCQKPEDFFTDATARELYKNRLRYIVARWGYSPHVLCWEFWNEIDLIENYGPATLPAITAWHREMSAELTRLDPYGRLQSTSFSKPEGEPAIDALAELAFVQTHSYTAQDLASDFTSPALQKSEAFNKPHLLGEFGLHWQGKGNSEDPEGLHLRETIWSTALSGSAGCGMSWWWDSYLEPRKLWRMYRPLAAFSADVPWTAPRGAPLIAEFSYAPGVPGVPQDLFLKLKEASWNADPSNAPQNLAVARDGSLSGHETLSGILHGRVHHRDKHNPIQLKANSSRPWTLAVKVTGVSGYGGATLKITINDLLTLSENFIDNDDLSNATITEYNKIYSVLVPAGEHTVRIENTGTDWVTCEYRLLGYGESSAPPLRLFQTQTGGMTVGWIQNTTASHLSRSREVTPRMAVGARLTLSPLSDGAYSLELWNTVDGSYETRAIDVSNGSLQINLPAISSDLAFKLRRK